MLPPRQRRIGALYTHVFMLRVMVGLGPWQGHTMTDEDVTVRAGGGIALGRSAGAGPPSLVACDACGVWPASRCVQALIKEYDTNGDGEIDFNEFFGLTEKRAENVLRDAFAVSDGDLPSCGRVCCCRLECTHNGRLRSAPLSFTYNAHSASSAWLRRWGVCVSECGGVGMHVDGAGKRRPVTTTALHVPWLAFACSACIPYRSW